MTKKPGGITTSSLSVPVFNIYYCSATTAHPRGSKPSTAQQPAILSKQRREHTAKNEHRCVAVKCAALNLNKGSVEFDRLLWQLIIAAAVFATRLAAEGAQRRCALNHEADAPAEGRKALPH